MSLVASLNVGVSALRAFSNGIQVISNNIANVSTVGYKSSHANYSDTFNNLLKPLVPNETGGGAKIDPTQIGGGVQVQSVTATFSQGTISATTTTSDLAIAGPGFFRVENSAGTPFATRAGNFRFDSNGYLVTQGGLRVQGTYGATTTVAYNPANKSYNVKSGGSLPVEVAGKISGNTIEINDPLQLSKLKAGMVIYSGQAQDTRGTAGYQVNDFTLKGASIVRATLQAAQGANPDLKIDLSGQGDLVKDIMRKAFGDSGTSVAGIGSPISGPGIPDGYYVSAYDPAAYVLTLSASSNAGTSKGSVDLSTGGAAGSVVYPISADGESYSISKWTLSNMNTSVTEKIDGKGAPVNSPNLHAVITNITGNVVTLSSGHLLDTSAGASPQTFTFLTPTTQSFSASSMVSVNPSKPIFMMTIGSSAELCDGMIATLQDPNDPTKQYYAGVSKVVGSPTKILLNFGIYGENAPDANGTVVPNTNIPSASDFQNSSAVKFETNDPVMRYQSASKIGDVQVAFKENFQFNFTNENGDALSGAEAVAARSAVPTVKSFTVGTDGSLLAVLSNGQTFISGQVLLQDFNDPGALVREGDNLFSGLELAGPKNTVPFDYSGSDYSELTPGQHGLGVIQGSALELSNVDIGQEFATMITTQRSFQAGSRVISVTDQMLEETVNLKR